MAKDMTSNSEVESVDNDSDWGAPIRVPRKKKNLSAMVSIRFSSEEYAAIQKAATLNNQTVSAYVREAVIDKSNSIPASQPIKTGSNLSAPLTGTFSSSSPNGRAQIDFKFKVS